MDKKTIRFLSHMGARGVLGQAIYDYSQEREDFWAISDLDMHPRNALRSCILGDRI